MKTILTNCTVIDCTGEPARKDTTVIIKDDKIAELKPGTYQEAAGEEEVRIFDLEGGYVLPGLWNVHVHLGGLFPDPRPTRGFPPSLPGTPPVPSSNLGKRTRAILNYRGTKGGGGR